jgi:hypothetical protein
MSFTIMNVNTRVRVSGAMAIPLLAAAFAWAPAAHACGLSASLPSSVSADPVSSAVSSADALATPVAKAVPAVTGPKSPVGTAASPLIKTVSRTERATSTGLDHTLPKSPLTIAAGTVTQKVLRTVGEASTVVHHTSSVVPTTQEAEPSRPAPKPTTSPARSATKARTAARASQRPARRSAPRATSGTPAHANVVGISQTERAMLHDSWRLGSH